MVCGMCVVWCGVLCSILPFAPAVCYSKREPNIEEYWEKEKSMEKTKKKYIREQREREKREREKREREKRERERG